MEGLTSKPTLRLLLVIAAALLVTGTILVIGQIGVVSAAPAQGGLLQGADNDGCLRCHSGEGKFHTLPSGEQLPIAVDEDAYAQGVHGDFSCTTCHVDITDYPHPENPEVENLRDYAILYQESCKNCHTEQYEANLDSMHYEIFLAGNENAPMCNDCHEPHYQQPISGETQQGEKARIAQTCAQCHNAIYEEYTQGVHGEQVLANNPDVPTCVDCHGAHTVTDPTTAEARLNSIDLCADCHTDPVRMDKYGLSTDVLDTFIDDFHGKTAILFEPSREGELPNTPVCYDCHGVHRIVAVGDPEEGLQAKENLLVACQRCHPDASENFPTSWLGHYVPDRQKYPLVYWVTVAYNILIPAVLGVMVVFIASDIYRRVRTRGGAVKTEAPAQAEESNEE